MRAMVSVLRECETCGKTFRHQPSQGTGRFCSNTCHGISKRVDPVAYFWQHVTKSDGCWMWTGELTNHGYGQMPRSFRRRGLFGGEIKAHRVAWLLANGPIPDGLLALHRCDTPACVRHDHLFLGTHKDNAVDRDRKGRSNAPHGARAFGAKLNDQTVLTIRARYAAGATLEVLAREYAVSLATMARAVNGEAWKLVGGERKVRGAARGERHGFAKLTVEDVRAIRARYALGGIRQEDLAQQYGVGHSAISNILLRQTWTDVA